MKVEVASVADLEEIVRLNEVIFRGMYKRAPYTLEEYGERLFDKDYFALKAVKDGKIVGDSVVYEEGSGNFYLWIMGVKDEYREEGIGTALLRKTEANVIRRGCGQITAKVYNVSREMQGLLFKENYQIAAVSSEEDVKDRSVIFVKSLMME